MDIPLASTAPLPETRPGICAVVAPEQRQVPVVIASPHSGRAYPDAFLALSRLDGLTLRRSEDTYVDELVTPAAQLGIPVLKALFPRAFVDPNREPFELDPEMFADPLPAYVNTRSARVAAGLGTIAKIVAQGEEIYGGKLRLADALDRIERYYTPYHDALRALIDDTRARFGHCLLLDAHSMPSSCGPGRTAGRPRDSVDFVLGDCYGTACDPSVIDTAADHLQRRGFSVSRNVPYAGGYTTRHYGRPKAQVHCLQIEINRALYMDERSLERKPFIGPLAREIRDLVRALAQLDLHRAAA